MMEADSNISPENPIPIVDFGPAASGELDDLKRVATHVRAACEDIGFFYIANHPIPPALMSRVIEEAKLFFCPSRGRETSRSTGALRELPRLHSL